MIKKLANVGVYNRIHLNSVGDLLEPMNVPQLRDPEDNDGFDSILGQVSGVSIDHNKSFVNHGGDSATAITLLYKLRIAGLLVNSLDTTAADIIESTIIRELKRQIRTGEFKSQRRITMSSCDDSARLTNYARHPIERFSDIHYAVKFRACVYSIHILDNSTTASNSGDQATACMYQQ